MRIRKLVANRVGSINGSFCVDNARSPVVQVLISLLRLHSIVEVEKAIWRHQNYRKSITLTDITKPSRPYYWRRKDNVDSATLCPHHFSLYYSSGHKEKITTVLDRQTFMEHQQDIRISHKPHRKRHTTSVIDSIIWENNTLWNLDNCTAFHASLPGNHLHPNRRVHTAKLRRRSLAPFSNTETTNNKFHMGEKFELLASISYTYTNV